MPLFPSIRVDRVKEHSFLPSLMPVDGIVVDLGANKGDFSRMVSYRYGWRCFAVEANPQMWDMIPATKLVSKINAAVLDKDGPVDFDVSDNPEASSIASLSQGQGLKRITVEGMTFRTLLGKHQIQRVDLLKVDIEGAELALFESLTDDELRSIGQICVEFHELTGQTPVAMIASLCRRMRRIGFATFKMSLRHYGDVLFVNRNRCQIGSLRVVGIRWLSRNLGIGKRLWNSIRPPSVAHS